MCIWISMIKLAIEKTNALYHFFTYKCGMKLYLMTYAFYFVINKEYYI